MSDHEQNYTDDTVPHVPDWDTVALADIKPNPDAGGVTFDVWCSVCGQSGSFRVTLKTREVHWV